MLCQPNSARKFCDDNFYFSFSKIIFSIAYMTTLDNDFKQILSKKQAKYYSCEQCYYITCRKSNFDNHIKSIKHKNNADNNFIAYSTTPDNAILSNNSTKQYQCENCLKPFSDRAGLWRHKKKCSNSEKNDTINENYTTSQNSILIDTQNIPKACELFDKDLIIMLIKQNSELIKENSHLSRETSDLKTIMMKVLENGAYNVNSNNTNNSHNKTFNLQFFLNETCKDAMNISEFIENIKIDVSDLENMGRVGYVEGMSNILIKNLNVLDVTRRPIHCTDKKREILYIKDNNIWEKDDEQKNKLHKTIKRVSHKNIKFLPAYREKYPGCEFAISRFSDNYNKMIIEVMGGPGDNDTEKEDRIIQKIAKYITINKG
jgi:hypothetical protein